MHPPVIQKLIELFSKLPTVGPRTAARFVFYLIKLPQEELEELIEAIENLKQDIRICSFCFKPFQNSQEKLCEICSNNGRDKTTLCLVEKESDLNSIEDTKRYKGLYFILGGTISGLKKEDFEKIRAEELEQRMKNPENYGLSGTNFKEIIIATNPTTEGEATGLYLERKLKELNLTDIKITHLGRGLPVGGELEYADDETLASAFEGRK